MTFQCVQLDTYVIKPGDTLCSIARSEKVSLVELAAANGIRLQKVVHIEFGHRLWLPKRRPGVGEGTTASTSGLTRTRPVKDRFRA